MTNLATITQQIAELKTAYSDIKSKLAARMTRYDAPADFSNRFVDHIALYGPDHTLTTLKRTPDLFGIEPTLSTKVADDLAKAAYDLDDKATLFDQLISEREAHLRKADPERIPVLVMDGREFTFNTDTDSFRWLEEPGTTEALTLERVVPNSAGPAPENEYRRTRTR